MHVHGVGRYREGRESVVPQIILIHTWYAVEVYILLCKF